MYKLLFVFAVSVIACQAIPSGSMQGSYNRYFVYTVNNTRTPIELDLTNTTTLQETLLATRNTTVIIHGHQGSAMSTLNPTVKDALLAVHDVNVIVVDWSVYASQSYSNAAAAVASIGSNLAAIILELVEASVVSLDKLHLVGFDLGAHVAGFTGRNLEGKVARITGLNPSGKQWGSNSRRLRPSDALYVEILHTDGDGILGNGVGDAIGTVDIYVNGGNNQPGCLFNHFCSHNRAWEVFAATVERNHLLANQCGNRLQISLNTCRGRTIAVGNNELSKLGTGLFRVNTRRTYPY